MIATCRVTLCDTGYEKFPNLIQDSEEFDIADWLHIKKSLLERELCTGQQGTRHTGVRYSRMRLYMWSRNMTGRWWVY